MHSLVLVSLAVAMTAACTGAAASEPEPQTFAAAEPEAFSAEVQPVLGFDQWGTGEGEYTYHHLTSTCETLTHAHGRNAAWGLWRIPIWKVSGTVEAAENGSAQLRYTCTDGSACIEAGALDDTPDRVTEHVIPFETIDLARNLSAKVDATKAACARTY